MISLKELQYVCEQAKDVPYPGTKFAMETLETMKVMFEQYNKQYREKNYSIIFSDSEEFSFQISDTSVCHMLGVDFKSLVNGNYDAFLKEILGMDRQNSKLCSYEVLKMILEKYEEVIKFEEKEKTPILNYYKSRIKCSIFNKISEFENFNFAKIDSEKNSRVLFTPSNESLCPYFFIRLNRDKESNIYEVVSLLAPEKTKIQNYFGPKVTIPTQIIIDDNRSLDKIEATPKDKINLLNMYRQLITTYGIKDNLDISGDYLSMLSDLDTRGKMKKL